MTDDMRKQLTKYLTDAHSIEEQALQQLRKAPDLAEDPQFADVLRTHFTETEGHERQVLRLLEARGASPSATKDAVMRAGGSGFLLFARSQTDTTGKLAAHTLSYEALEWASYELLGMTADRAGEPDVAEIVRAIRDEESEMMQRVERLFDRTVETSLREKSEEDLESSLIAYLADAHAIEAQSIQLMESGREMLDLAELESVFTEHLSETHAQQELLEERLDAHGASRSLLKDAALKLGAFNWGMFFQAHPDTDAKLAAFAYAVEHLEIGGYEQLIRVARRAGDRLTVTAVEGILSEERRAAARIAATFPAAVDAVLPAESR